MDDCFVSVSPGLHLLNDISNMTDVVGLHTLEVGH